MTTFRKTLRKLAVEQDVDERLRLSDVLASQLEVTLDHQGDLNQVALSDTEEVLLGKIDGLNEQVGNNNILLSTFLEKFPEQMRSVVAEETARGLGGFREDIEALKQGQVAYNERLDQVISRLDADEERFDERLDRKRERLDEQERVIAELRRVVARHDQIIAERPAQRDAEWEARKEALVKAIVERLAQANGDGA